MARYIGAKVKIARKFNSPIFGEAKKYTKKNQQRTYASGTRRRGKKSEYALQLTEKQKAKHIYGILEKQFSNMFKKASRSKGVTGEVLLQLCESRLDNVVYRLGIAMTRSAARQLVVHRHITVNSRIVDIPSYHLLPGDVVGIRERSKSLQTINNALAMHTESPYDWITWNRDKLQGNYLSVPQRDQIPESVKEQLIVELYSK